VTEGRGTGVDIENKAFNDSKTPLSNQYIYFLNEGQEGKISSIWSGWQWEGEG
jgi:hypothetical protein